MGQERKPEPGPRTPIGDVMGHGRTYFALTNNGFWTVDDLLQFSADDLLQFCWFGGNDLRHVEWAVAAAGCRLPPVSAAWVREVLGPDLLFVGRPLREALRERNGDTARALYAARYGGTD